MVTRTNMKRGIQRRVKVTPFMQYTGNGVSCQISHRLTDMLVEMVPQLNGNRMDAMAALTTPVKQAWGNLRFLKIGQQEIITKFGPIFVATLDGQLYADMTEFFPFE